MAEADWLNALPAAVFLVRDQRILFANRAAADLIGSAQQELTGLPLETYLDGAENGNGARLKTHADGVIAVDSTHAQIEYEGQPAQLITLQKRETPDFYRAVIASSNDSFFLGATQRDANGKIVDFRALDANKRALEKTGLTRDQLIGRTIRELMPADRAQRLIDQFAPLVARGKPYYHEHNLVQTLIKDGWYDVQLIPLEDERVALFLRDITERREAEDVVQRLALEVEQQARLLDEMLSATPDSFILFDHAGRYLYVNQTGLENSGLTIDQISGKTWREIGFPEEAGLLFEERLHHVFSTGESITYEEQFPTMKGLRDFLTTLTPIHDAEGNVIFMLNTIHDITERKDAEREQQKLSAELEQQARVFDEVLSTTPDNILMIDRDGKFLYANRSSLRNVHMAPPQVVGKTWREMGFPEEEGKHADSMMTQVFETGEPIIFESQFPTVGGLRSFESIYSPLHDKDGKVISIVITNRDITERKQMEEALRENQRLLTSIYDTALVGIAVMNAEGNFVQVNRTYCEIYGYEPGELIGRHYSILFPDELVGSAQETHDRFIRGEAATVMSDWTVVRKDGRRIEISAYNSLLVRENGERFRVAVVIDVTAQKQAQRAREESEQRLTSILNSMEDAVWSVQGENHQLLYANPAIEALTGYSAGEFTENPHLLIDIVHHDDRNRFAAELRRALNGVRIDIEYQIIRRDGTPSWVHNRFWVVNGAEGKRIDGIMTDITERKRSADQTMQLAMERERVRILSDFVRDASHEFRTPLSVINTRLYLIEKVNDPERQAQYIEGIREQAERILKLVESLITMSQLDSATELELERLDLNHLLTLMQVSAEITAQRKGVGFLLELAPEPLTIQGEPDKLLIALNAVFDNAVNYTPPGEQITIRSHRLNSGEVAVDVRDSGVGISPADLPHIFERFYRVDQARSMYGFGLGLPIARKVIDMHLGRIEVESKPKQGSLFRLIFPSDPPPT